jgi:hypothetical protein
VRDGLALGKLRPAGTEDLYGVPKATMRRSMLRPTPKPNRIAAEVDPRVHQSSRAIAEGLGLGPQPS